ncbi:MAG: AraC family transcriptional regulator ligand-binding domain-containing protein [Neptunomonas phycophila]|uniref:AraC family transcriptional regulator n=1 Tax=Neptunomonas phycophila TaxID=1572645 RepID=UPI003B8CAEFA
MDFTDETPITLNDKVYSTADILAIIACIDADSDIVEDCLSTGSISIHELYDPTIRISLNQQDKIQLAFEKKINDSFLGLKVGNLLHLTSYGIIGFTLLSSENFRDAIRIATNFSVLINLKLRLQLKVSEGQAYIKMIDTNGLLSSNSIFGLYVEISKMLTLLRDIRGKEFTPDYVDLCLSGSIEQAEEIGFIIGAPVRLNKPENCIVFPEYLLDEKLPQSNEITHNSCKLVCQEQMRENFQKYDLSYKVQKLLFKSDTVLSLSEVADSLHLSPRTLRRRLDSLGTSYNALLMEVRKKLAIHYLLNTRLTTEDISEHLKYSDAANFRHAFKRWTGCSPRSYRHKNKGCSTLNFSLESQPLSNRTFTET